MPSMDAAIDTPYPAVSTAGSIRDVGENGQDKAVDISATPEIGNLRTWPAALWSRPPAGAKVLVVRNTVGYAVSTQQKIEELAPMPMPGCASPSTAYRRCTTGGLRPGDRRLLDRG